MTGTVQATVEHLHRDGSVLPQAVNQQVLSTYNDVTTIFFSSIDLVLAFEKVHDLCRFLHST